MSELTPAERELREKLRHLTRDPGPLGSAVCALLKAAKAEFPVMVMPDESSAILDLLAQQEAPTTSEIDSLDADMEALYDQLCAEGRERDALIVERAAYAIEALEADRTLRAAVREAPPISDTEVARIIEAVEAHCGMAHGAWDMVAARDLVEGFAAALGACLPSAR